MEDNNSLHKEIIVQGIRFWFDKKNCNWETGEYLTYLKIESPNYKEILQYRFPDDINEALAEVMGLELSECPT